MTDAERLEQIRRKHAMYSKVGYQSDNEDFLLAQLDAAEAEIKRLREQLREKELNEYGWQCSGCKTFTKYYTFGGKCPECGRNGYLTGSFNRGDLERWFDSRQALQPQQGVVKE